jgi:LuxR family transcriptional regulator, maltose regulon positive regulatory protein
MTDSGMLPRDKPTGPGGGSPMPDPSGAAPAGVAMSGPDVLLSTKLHVPWPVPGFVPRRRLVEALGEGLARGRVLVCAPAGFGKTALLADWARSSGRPVAWLGLDGGDSDPAGFAAAFSGSHRFVLDYLTDEVLDGQPGQVRAFLLETSVLERLSGELCDAVTGRAGSQAMLQDIERAGLFLAPLDEVRGWWRYHHLFADLLRARLQAEQPGRVPALHRAAAAWCEEHDLADDAVRHALAAGDAEWTARLVERHVEALLGRSEGATLRRWLSALPAESVRDRPRLCLAQAYGAAQGFQLEALEALLEDAEHAFAASGDEPYHDPAGRSASVLANVPGGIAFLRASLARLRGDAALAAVYNRQALAQLGEDDWLLRSFVRWNRAVTDWLDGLLGPAERGLTEVLAELRSADDAVRRVGDEPTEVLRGVEGGADFFAGFLAMRVCYDLAQVQRAQGNLDGALATYRQALDTAGESSQTAHAGLAHVGLAQVLYERNELTSALDHATRESRCAGSWLLLCRWLPAWLSWPGSGARMVTRPGLWRRWTRPGRSS